MTEEINNIKTNLEINRSSISNQINDISKRNIELLALFTAVIALIFGTVNIIQEFKVNESLILLMGLTITLIIFSITIRYLFSDEYKKHGSKGLGLLLIIGLLIYYVLYQITNESLKSEQNSAQDISIIRPTSQPSLLPASPTQNSDYTAPPFQTPL